MLLSLLVRCLGDIFENILATRFVLVLRRYKKQRASGKKAVGKPQSETACLAKCRVVKCELTLNQTHVTE